MSSSNDPMAKLWITAVAAGVTGAAVGIGLIKLWDRQQQQQQQQSKNSINNIKYPYPNNESLDGRLQRPSMIFEDPNNDILLDTSVSNMIDQPKKLLFPHNHEEKMRRRIAARVAVEEDNYVPRDSVTVRVPATSANMGPGCKSSRLFGFFFIMLSRT
jgi:WD40 repeat protein